MLRVVGLDARVRRGYPAEAEDDNARQFEFVLASFDRKTTLPERYFRAFSPVFCAFLQNEPNSVFFITVSCRNTCAFFSWVRLAKTYFYIKPSRWERHDATPQAARQGEPSRRERVQFPPANHHFDGSDTHVSMIHAHTPILSHSEKYRMRTLEGLEGLEAFLLGSV
jgi:hypothetical protein